MLAAGSTAEQNALAMLSMRLECHCSLRYAPARYVCGVKV